MKKIKKKAFIGTIINGVGALAGVIGKGIQAKKDAELQQQQYENQQGQIYKQGALNLANVLSQEANSQEYVQQMKNRISIDRLGGQHKTKRIKKKKAFIGTAITGVADLIGGLSYKPKDYTLKYTDSIQAQAPKVLKTPNNMVQQTNLAMQQVTNPQLYNNQVQNPILSQAKLGTKRIKQKNLNRFK